MPRRLPRASDALRRAALEKSWQRDRRVGRRRVAWRWMLWLLWRYGLPAAAAGVLAAAAVWGWRTVGPTPAPTQAPPEIGLDDVTNG